MALQLFWVDLCLFIFGLLIFSSVTLLPFLLVLFTSGDPFQISLLAQPF
jgi:hypothetical protein